jgi:catechol 2,3-dioxygenase-like lactoylglutathione lyase family enzyme
VRTNSRIPDISLEEQMISGAHVVVYSKDAEADRAFFRDVLGFKSVDAGHGWLIFALPPAEAAFHPSTENGPHELYFMCDGLKAEMTSLAKKGLSALRLRKHDGVRLRRCGFPVAARSDFISQNIRRPSASA